MGISRRWIYFNFRVTFYWTLRDWKNKHIPQWWFKQTMVESFLRITSKTKNPRWFWKKRVPSGKLTWQWNTPNFDGKYIFKGSIFHCYVRLPECNCFSGGQWSPKNILAWILSGFPPPPPHFTQTRKVQLMVPTRNPALAPVEGTVVYLIILRGFFFASQVVGLGISSINIIIKKKGHFSKNTCEG